VVEWAAAQVVEWEEPAVWVDKAWEAALAVWELRETLTPCVQADQAEWEVDLEVWVWEAAWVALEEWECKDHLDHLLIKRKSPLRFS